LASFSPIADMISSATILLEAVEEARNGWTLVGAPGGRARFGSWHLFRAAREDTGRDRNLAHRRLCAGPCGVGPFLRLHRRRREVRRSGGPAGSPLLFRAAAVRRGLTRAAGARPVDARACRLFHARRRRSAPLLCRTRHRNKRAA